MARNRDSDEDILKLLREIEVNPSCRRLHGLNSP